MAQVVCFPRTTLAEQMMDMATINEILGKNY